MAKTISNDDRIDTLLTTRNNLINPVISFDQTNTLGQGVEITYNFPVAGTLNDPNVAGFQALSSAQQAAIEDAMDMISSFVNVTFREVSAGQSADLEYAVGNLSGNTQGLASSLYRFLNGGQFGYIEDVTITFDSDLASASNIGEGSDFYFVAIHEIGHALGLDHPFEGITVNGVNEDTASTVMAYDDGFGGTSLDPSTLMRNDFLALAYLYGENTSTFAGNTVHRFTADDFRGDGRIKLIWDASGTDTFDFSGIISASSTISGGERFYSISLTGGDRLLREASSSSSFDNVFLADGIEIENVMGTRFDDRITGTNAANSLEGGNGRDILNGGAGDDEIHGNAFAEPVEIDDPTSLVDVNGWLFKFANENGAQDGEEPPQVGQALNTFLGVDAADGIGLFADDNSADELFGGAGNDALNGGGGADFIEGGTGNDTLTGGASTDEFQFGASDGNDTITDFDARLDTLKLDDANWSGTLSALQVVNTFGTALSDAFVFDFGGTRIELQGSYQVTELTSAIEIF